MELNMFAVLYKFIYVWDMFMYDIDITFVLLQVVRLSLCTHYNQGFAFWFALPSSDFSCKTEFTQMNLKLTGSNRAQNTRKGNRSPTEMLITYTHTHTRHMHLWHKHMHIQNVNIAQAFREYREAIHTRTRIRMISITHLVCHDSCHF